MKWKPYEDKVTKILIQIKVFVSILLMKWKPYEVCTNTELVRILPRFNPSYEMEALRRTLTQEFSFTDSWFQSFL